jgi:hypothetical protein
LIAILFFQGLWDDQDILVLQIDAVVICVVEKATHCPILPLQELLHDLFPSGGIDLSNSRPAGS